VRKIAALFLLSACVVLARPKALFYMTESPESVRSFLAHVNKVDIIVPTWYQVDANGLVWGGPNPLVLQTAKAHHVPVVPIVTNSGFNQEAFHKLASNADARQSFLRALISECKKNGYEGIQFDLEHLLWTDRDALTQLVAEAADSFHKERLQLSIATVPNAPGTPGESNYSHWNFENWQGAYDLKALAQHVDLICLMTYSQHTVLTPPGPIAAYPWTVQNLDYALQSVPKERLSLGIPVYGSHWFAGDPIHAADGKDTAHVLSSTITGQDAQLLIDTYHPQVEWDDHDKSTWFYFYRAGTREWVFYTDRRTFQARYNLTTERGLQGFCSWVLGEEDPGIWDVLPAHQ